MLHVSNLSISPVIFHSLADFSDVSDKSEDAIEWSEVESEEEQEENTDVDESAEEMEEPETTSAEQGENSDSDTGTDDSPLEKGSLKNAGCGTADVFGATGSDDAGFNGEFPSAGTPLHPEIASGEEWAEWESRATGRLLFQKWRYATDLWIS